MDAAALTEMGHPIGADTVRKELAELGFSRQANRKTTRARAIPDRDAQFEHINAKVLKVQAAGEPVISDDRTYEQGIKVSKAEMASLDITGDPFHPE
jgi:hypothetical protein